MVRSCGLLALNVDISDFDESWGYDTLTKTSGGKDG
jgi:hypothetical protein